MSTNHIAIILFSLMAAGLAGFTGCNNSNASDVSIDQSTSSAPENFSNIDSSNVSTDMFPSTHTDETGRELSSEAQKLLSALKKQNFTGPDGEDVQVSDASDIYSMERYGRGYDDEIMIDENGDTVLDEYGIPKYKDDEWVDTILKYDFAYVTYAKPYCKFGLTGGETGEEYYNKISEFDNELQKLQTDRTWLKIKAGDILKNGLTVLEAECEVLPTAKTNYHSMGLRLVGECTIEGILSFREKDDYLLLNGEAVFNPDASVLSGFPIIYNGSINKGYCTAGAFTGGYLACDGQGMRLGMVDDLDIDKDEIFGERNCARVKITFKDPYLHTNNKTDQMQTPFIELNGEIVDIERVD